ncbi:hypothetical protein Hanom_Chr10g00910761 [Helianthus anomalus]
MHESFHTFIFIQVHKSMFHFIDTLFLLIILNNDDDENHQSTSCTRFHILSFGYLLTVFIVKI